MTEINLFSDQQKLVNKARASIGRGCKSLLIQATTGAGKTVMASSMIKGSNAKGFKTAFCVPRKQLLEQMGKTFRKYDIDYSYVASGEFFDESSMNHVCSMQTLVNRLDVIDPRVIYFDETHWGEGQLNKIIKHFKETPWIDPVTKKSHQRIIIGLSATPWKMNGRGLGCYYDDMVEGESVRWLMDNKRLSDYRLFGVSNPDLSMIKMVNGEYSQTQLREKMEGDKVLIGDAVSHYKKHAYGKLNVTFCASIKHSKMTAEAFNNAGIPAAHMDAETPMHERMRIIKDFALRKLWVICSVDLLCFGFDLASQVNMDVTVECLSDLRPTMSLALQMQKWGRVLRMKDEPALIFDHAGNSMKFDGTENHGLPCMDRLWTLLDRQKKSKKDEEEKAETTRRCPDCFNLHKPQPKCPCCGHIYKIKPMKKLETIDAELREIEIVKKKRAARIQEGMCETLEDWKEVAKDRGNSEAWANIRYKKREEINAKKKLEKLNGQIELI
ncbi:MAG: hypothetical protein COB09_19025 [Thalassobium sp.]|nr:MAG: hypothetical protein COB09_19025 [Thalassobium sp.]